MADRRTRTSWTRRRPVVTSLASMWMVLLAIVVAIGLLVAAATLRGSDQEAEMNDIAPGFALPDTAGGTVRLSDILSNRDALLYFSMGVGCDPCFAQIPEIAAELDARDIALVPIMVGRPDWLAGEAARLGVDMPIAVDADRSVSEDYGMLGQYGHGDVPSHSFALVRRSGEIAWVRHYAEMFVPADNFFAELPG